MAERNRRKNVTKIEPDYASSALDEADPDPLRITEILNGIPGTWERAQESIAQARRSETVPLSEL